MKKLLELFIIFFKIGLFTFGGGYAMLALIDSEVVEKKQWLTEGELSDIFAVAESTPGPIAINCATYIGYKQGGVLGSALATFGVVLPSLIIIYIISLFLDAFLQIELIAKAFMGIKCAVAVLITQAGLKLFKGIKKNALSYILMSATFVAMLLVNFFSVKFSSIFFIIIGAVVAIIIYGIQNRKEDAANSQDEGGCAK